jgi:F-type H+-transporting ATPase subunit b
LVNFTILLLLFRAFLFKPLLGVMDERRRRIQESLEAADRMRDRESETQKETQVALEEARREGQALIAQAQQIASRIQEEARQQAQREADALLGRARSEIQLERDNAITDVRREFADLTITAAEQVIKQSLDRQAHQRLIDEVLAESATSSATSSDRGQASTNGS